MIEQHFLIGKYDWQVIVVYEVDKYDKEYCINKIKSVTKNAETIKEVNEFFETYKKDTAYVYTDYNKQVSVLFVSEHSSTGEFLDTITHEANHIQSHIATKYDIDEKGEEVCYLIGYIVKTMYNVFKQII